jgi:hypothetical protein
MSIAYGGDNITFPDASTQNTSPKTGFVNRIINGGMTIDQRNAGASVTPASGAVTYALDRYAFFVNQASKLTVQQSTTVPTGFKNSMVVTSSSAYSSGASDVFVMFQSIEGLNVSDLGWGAAGAQAITISFWFRSSLTGTHSGAVSNSGNTRSYPFTFTVSSANTYEYKTVTIAGDTSGTWLTTNGIGLSLKFNCGSGSLQLGTAGAWASADLSGVTGSVSLVGTSGATFYITGVQLEKGSVATSFDFRSIGTELGLCQRYYYRFVPQNTTERFCVAYASATTTADGVVVFPVSMRAAPAALEQSGTAADYNITFGGGNANCSAVPTVVVGSANNQTIRFTVASGLTNSWAVVLRSTTTSAYLGFSAEL